MERALRSLLISAVVVPILYFGSVLLSASFYPGYSHVTQYASELGSSQAPYPAVFNAGIALTGLATILAGVGLYRAAAALAHRRILSALTGASLALFGVALVVGALFPMPDPRHNAFGLGVTIHFTPFLMAAALRGHPSFRILNRFLVVMGLVMAVLFAVSMGVGSLVTRANVGIVQRTYASAVFVWLVVAAVMLLRHARPQPQT